MNDPLAVRETLPNEDVKRNHPNDALAGRPIFPNEQATKNYLASTYGPQVQKTFIGALESFFASEFPQLAGDRARRAIVQAIVDLTLRFFPATTHLRQGQTTWVSVDKNETSAYGKSMAKTRLVPVIISLMADDEAKQRQNGKKLTDLKREAVARICHEVDTQGGCITAAELALILKTTPPTKGQIYCSLANRTRPTVTKTRNHPRHGTNPHPQKTNLSLIVSRRKNRLRNRSTHQPQPTSHSPLHHQFQASLHLQNQRTHPR